MSDVINRKLAEAKAQIEKIHSDLNKPQPKERVTKNMCPPLPEAPDSKGSTEQKIPGFITGGPKRSNKHKQV